MYNGKILFDFPVIETKRLILRKLKDEDVEDIFSYACMPEMTVFLIWYPHKVISESLDFIKFTWDEFEKGSSIVWGIELKEENKIVGTIDLRGWKSDNRCGDIGYGLSPKYWSKGIITEAMNAVINFGFTNLRLHRIEAHCEEANTGSWKVMEKCGMRFEGLLREKAFFKDKFRSMKMYSILRQDWDGKN